MTFLKVVVVWGSGALFSVFYSFFLLRLYLLCLRGRSHKILLCLLTSMLLGSWRGWPRRGREPTLATSCRCHSGCRKACRCGLRSGTLAIGRSMRSTYKLVFKEFCLKNNLSHWREEPPNLSCMSYRRPVMYLKTSWSLVFAISFREMRHEIAKCIPELT